MSPKKYDPAVHHDALLEVPPPTDSKGKEGGTARRSARSVTRAKCPACATAAPVGIVLQGSHLVWRLHDKVTHSGARMACGASGVALCVAGPVPLAGVTTPACVCVGR